MDRFGINLETTFEARAETVVEMCRRGYADRMVLSQDASCYIDWIDPAVELGDPHRVDALLRLAAARTRRRGARPPGGRRECEDRPRHAAGQPIVLAPSNDSRMMSACPQC
ncbi:phosphotriesterase family protein [Streptomyces sp. NPDC055400]